MNTIILSEIGQHWPHRFSRVMIQTVFSYRLLLQSKFPGSTTASLASTRSTSTWRWWTARWREPARRRRCWRTPPVPTSTRSCRSSPPRTQSVSIIPPSFKLNPQVLCFAEEPRRKNMHSSFLPTMYQERISCTFCENNSSAKPAIYIYRKETLSL